MQAAFHHNTPPDLTIGGHNRLRPEPLAPFVTPVSTTAEIFEPYAALQEAMYTAQPFTHVHTLEADRSSAAYRRTGSRRRS